MMAIMFDFLLEPALVQSVFEAGDDGGFAKRLDKIVVGAGAHGFDAHVHVVYASRDEERHVGMMMANFGEEFHAAQAWHLKVGDDGVERLALQSYEGFFGSASGSATKCRRRQDKGKKPNSGRFIIYGEDASDKRVVGNGNGRGVFGFLYASLIGFVHGDVRIAPYCSTQGPAFSVKTHP